MRELRQKRLFKGDLRRVLGGRYRKTVMPDGEFQNVVDMLRHDISLPSRYYDHALIGDMEGSRECHIKPDLLLVYRYEGDGLLILERLGSHAEIFGL